MVIGIDIDDTITNTSKYANALLKNDKKFNYISDYHDLKKEDYNEFINKYIDEIHNNVSLKENVVDVLNKWHKLGIKIVFITARGRDNNKKAISTAGLFFAVNNIYYDKIIFNQISKYEVCKKENVDIFIDDKEEVLDEIKAHDIKTLRITPSKRSNHKIVKSWKEIDEFIEKWGSYGRENN